MPVETTRTSEVVVIVGVVLLIVAVTRTGVLSVPAFTIVCTKPVTGSESALVVDKDSPPVLVFANKEKVTVFLMAFPFVSSTLKTTMDVSLLPSPPVPLRAMLVGVAETKEIDPADAELTVIVPVCLRVFPEMESVAVIVSAAP